MLMEILFTVAGLLLGWLLRKVSQYVILQKTKSASSLPPLPPSGPSLQTFGKEAQNCRLPRTQLSWAQQYGSLYTVRSPFTAVFPHILLCGDVGVAKQLLLQEAGKQNFTSRPPSIAWATQEGEGPSLTGMVSTDDEWKWRKTALLKEFHRKRMAESERGLLVEIVRSSKELCQCFSAAAVSQKPMEVDYITTYVTIDVMMYFLWGRRMDFDPRIFRNSAQTMLETVFQCSTNPLYFVLRYLPWTSCYAMDHKRDAAWKAMDCVMQEEVDKVLREIDHTAMTTTLNSRKPGAALVSLLTKEPKFRAGGMESLVADIRVFLLAGFETTAHGLSFAFGLLALHPELAEKIANEGRAIWNKLQSDDAAEIQQALDQAPTARLFFLETIRLYPLVPTLPGECLENVIVHSSQGEVYGLPKGTKVLFTNMVLNRQQGGTEVNPSLWDAPPEQQPFMNTFNTGAHVCPGKALSLLEAHVFFFMAATQFEFVLPSQQNKEQAMEFLDNVMLKPKEGMPLLIRERVFST